MLVGYMRVSSADDRQSVNLQRDALTAAGVEGRRLHHRQTVVNHGTPATIDAHQIIVDPKYGHSVSRVL